MIARRRHVLVLKWMNKKEILMISTPHNGEFTEVSTKFGHNHLKPKVIVEYNEFIGDVDKADQLTSYYSSPRKTMRR